ncbi:uncharacterized protein LOC134766586 [Penaeus indicus]|uniref:uncharacterized protein LOC134766586 n=1 Tax=Penaeus indicus TaxID=29960 RepID=UPI00300D6011
MVHREKSRCEVCCGVWLLPPATESGDSLSFTAIDFKMENRNHHTKVYHNCIDFKKAFGRVWHDALWHTVRKYNIGKGMTELIQNLYGKARTTVLVGNTYSDWFKSTVGVRQGYDIDLIANSTEKLADLTKRLDTIAKRFGIEISAEKKAKP